MLKSVPFAIVTTGFIVGGAILGSAWIQRPRYSLVIGSDMIARLDVHSGQIVTCYPNPATAGQAKNPELHGLQTFGVVCLNGQGQ